MRREEQKILISSIPNFFNETHKRIICGVMSILMVAASVLPANRVLAYTYEPGDSPSTPLSTETVHYATTEDGDFDASNVKIVG
jgi:hypothetical protein